ncbi:MAG TPA: cytochrome c-type biogenesis protein CcmH [Acidimicrobiales bacterium]|nr:cytochrome c-type biogenesis protein CcmH [Acidimicrobiales bacterium]
MKRWLPVLVLLGVLVAALVIGGSRHSKGPTVASRVNHISAEVRCPTCEGLSAKDSDAPASIAIREQIKTQVEAGYRDGEIRAYLVDRYGQDILLKPDGRGVSALVWALPAGGLVAALAGLVLVFRRWRRPRVVPGEDDDALVAAAVPGQSEEVDFLLASLADLDREREAGDLAESDYAGLRADYTARAAAALRGSSPVALAAPPSRLRSAAVALGVVALASVAGLAVARGAGERTPGASAAGGITDTGPGEKLSRAAALAGQGKVLDAIRLYDEVIASDPQNAQALAYRGWLVRLAGRSGGDVALIDKGLSFIDRAIAADPGYPDAHFFRGEILLRDKNQPAAAIPEFQAFLNGGGAPEMATLVEGELRAAQEAAK